MFYSDSFVEISFRYIVSELRAANVSELFPTAVQDVVDYPSLSFNLHFIGRCEKPVSCPQIESTLIVSVGNSFVAPRHFTHCLSLHFF